MNRAPTRMKQLFYKEYGSGPPLVILHGLFGSQDNWKSVAERLSANFHVIIPDLRNHGQSFHSDEMNYDVMVADIVALLSHLKLNSTHLLGHSMGGKLAMKLALSHPQFITSLIVADMAPKIYAGSPFLKLTDSLLAIDLKSLKSRKEADDRLKDSIPDMSVRLFLLKNLKWNDQKGLEWQVNLKAIQTWIKSTDTNHFNGIYDGKTLFIKGSLSDYIMEGDEVLMKRYFPKSELKVIEGAGHWPHVERPREFLRVVEEFL